MIPRFGVPPDPTRTYRRRPGAYGLLIRDGMALLTGKIGQGDLQLPGGGIDLGEGQVQSLRREIREETGWTIGPARRIGAYRRYAWLADYGIWAEKMCHLWLARPILRRGPPVDAGHEAVWVPLVQLPDLVEEPAARALLRHSLGLPPATYPGRPDRIRDSRIDRPPHAG